MINLWRWIKNNPNRSMFLLPILLVAGISISHVVSWYDMANPINWAIYLSIAIEVGAITALVAATNKIKGGIWFMFGLVTFIQMIGNIFYSYKEIDATGELFKSWVELTGPVWELMGTETTDLVGMKRWLAFLEGGLLPIISLTSLHFFVRYEKPEEDTLLNHKVDDVEEDMYNTMTNHPEDVYTPKEEEKEYTQEDKEKIKVKPEHEVLMSDGRQYFNPLKVDPYDKDSDNVVIEPPVNYKDEIPYVISDEKLPLEIVIEGENQPHLKTEQTPGDKLNQTWKNIIKNRVRTSNDDTTKM